MNRQVALQGMLIAATKSGSTWLARACARHPDIFVCRGQNIKISPENGIEHIDWSGYAEQKVCLGRINIKLKPYYADAYVRYNPDMKFVSLLRDPVERSYSHFAHWVRKKRTMRESITANITTLRKVVFDFNQAVADGIQEEVLPAFIAKSMYFHCLKPYATKFRRENFLMLSFEVATEKPAMLFEKLCEFLQIEYIVPPGIKERVNVKSYSSQNFLRKRVEIIPPTEETINVLRELFYPDVVKLEKLMGISLRKQWKYFA